MSNKEIIEKLTKDIHRYTPECPLDNLREVLEGVWEKTDDEYKSNIIDTLVEFIENHSMYECYTKDCI